MKIVRIVILLLGISLICSPCAGKEKPKRGPLVKSVSFVGNEIYKSSLLQNLMATKPPSFFSKTYFKKSRFLNDLSNIETFYHQQGYLEAAITDTSVAIDTTHSVANIKLTIFEGQLTIVDSLTLSGNTIFSDSTLLKMVNLNIGGALLGNQLQNAIFSISSFYADSGYIYATVTPDTRIDSAAHMAAINFQLHEGPRVQINAIDIKGLQKTKRFVVARELEFKVGDIIHYSKLLDTQRRLFLTGLFSSVFITPKPLQADDSSQAVIVIRLKERLSSAFSYSVGYGTVEKIMTGVEVSTINLAGTARQIRVRGNADFINRGGEISLTQPWTLGIRLRTNLKLLYGFQQQPAFHLYTTGVDLSLGRNFTRITQGSLTVRYENSRLTAVPLTGTPSNFNPRIRSIIAELVRDSRDDILNPSRGLYEDLSVEVAGALLSGNSNFTRYILRLKWFHSFTPGTVLASSYQTGVIRPFGSTKVLPISEEFFSGGPTTLRGFSYEKVGPLDPNGTPLGGNFVMVGNLELRKAIHKIFSTVIFLDIGNVWQRAKDFRPMSLRWDIGPGLRVNTPIGTVGLDYGFNVKPHPREPRGRLFLRMGQAF